MKFTHGANDELCRGKNCEEEGRRDVIHGDAELFFVSEAVNILSPHPPSYVPVFSDELGSFDEDCPRCHRSYWQEPSDIERATDGPLVTMKKATREKNRKKKYNIITE